MSDDQIREIRNELKRITDALLGDPAMGTRGMVCRLQNVESVVNEIQQERRDEKAERKGAWKLAALIATVSGSIGGFAVDHFTRKG